MVTNENKLRSNKGLKFKSLRVDLIYSAAANVSKKLFSLDSPLIKSYSGTDTSPGKFQFSLGSPEQRIGVTPSLQLKGSEIHRELTELQSYELEFEDNKKAEQKFCEYKERKAIKLGGLVRIARGGAVSITITVDFVQPMDETQIVFGTIDVFYVLGLIKQANATGPNNKGARVRLKSSTGESTTLDHWIVRLLKRMNEEVESVRETDSNSAESGNDNESSHSISTRNQEKQNESHNVPEQLGFILDLGLLPKGFSIDDEKASYQNPYLVVSGELTEDEQDSKTHLNWRLGLFGESDKSERKMQELSLLLRRYVGGQQILENDLCDLVSLPESFMSSDSKVPKLSELASSNLSWFNNMFIASHARSTIFLYLHPEMEGDTFVLRRVRDFLLHSILDLHETLRGRWHFRTILNYKLDEAISNLTSYPREPALLKNYYDLRRLYARFLTSPLSHRLEGGVVYNLYVLSRKYYNLEELAKLNVQKFEVIDSILKDVATINDLKFSQEFRERMAERAKTMEKSK